MHEIPSAYGVSGEEEYGGYNQDIIDQMINYRDEIPFETRMTDEEDYDDGNESIRKKKLYKTQMCRHILATGSCSHGMYCHFAHSESELRLNNHVPNKNGHDYTIPTDDPAFAQYAQLRYKTRLCRHMARSGRCPRGDTCCFAHSDQELRTTPSDDFHSSSNRSNKSNRWTIQSSTQQHQLRRASLENTTHNDDNDDDDDSNTDRRIIWTERQRPRLSMFKTRMCRYAEAKVADQCPRGDACTFAHSQGELRHNPLQLKQPALSTQPRTTAEEVEETDSRDYTVAWKGAIFAARNSRTQLIALRDTLIRQCRAGNSFELPPTVPPLALKTTLNLDPSDSDDDGPSYLIQSAFEAGLFATDVSAANDHIERQLNIISPGSDSTQVRYLCLEIECCFAEELRRCAEANARRRKWLLMARYLAATFDLITALLHGIEVWHLTLIKHQREPLPNFHQKQQLTAVLHVLAVVRDQTNRVCNEAMAACETVLISSSNTQQSERENAAQALQDLRQLSF